jgi:hypothetical protein
MAIEKIEGKFTPENQCPLIAPSHRKEKGVSDIA